MPPYVNSVNPNSGDSGDRFTVEILGDVFSHVTKVSFGSEIEVDSFTIIDDGTIRAKIIIANHATPGKREVVLTDPTGGSEPKPIFEVL